MNKKLFELKKGDIVYHIGKYGVCTKAKVRGINELDKGYVSIKTQYGKKMRVRLYKIKLEPTEEWLSLNRESEEAQIELEKLKNR